MFFGASPSLGVLGAGIPPLSYLRVEPSPPLPSTSCIVPILQALWWKRRGEEHKMAARAGLSVFHASSSVACSLDLPHSPNSQTSSPSHHSLGTEGPLDTNLPEDQGKVSLLDWLKTEIHREFKGAGASGLNRKGFPLVPTPQGLSGKIARWMPPLSLRCIPSCQAQTRRSSSHSWMTRSIAWCPHRYYLWMLMACQRTSVADA